MSQKGPHERTWTTKRTESKPKEYAPRLLRAAPSGETSDEVFTDARVWVVFRVLATRFRPRGDGGHESKRGRERSEGRARTVETRRDARDEHAEHTSGTGQNDPHTDFLECTSQFVELFVFFVDDGNEDHEGGEEYAEHGHEDGETGKASYETQRSTDERAREEWKSVLTGTDTPLCLETGHAGETGHGKKVEEYLGGMKDDGGFGYDHLEREQVSASEAEWRERQGMTASQTTHSKGTKRSKTSVPAWSMQA